MERNCQTSNPQCDLSLKAKTIGTGEAALLHLFLKQDDSIPYSSLKTLFVEGRIPDERNDVGIASLLSTLVALRTRITFVRRRALESNEFPNSFTEEDWIKLFQ